MPELVLLLVLAVVVTLWHDGRRAHEAATARCKLACQAAGVQLLDEVAPMWRLGLMRDARGTLRLRRIYTFDYCTPAGERRRGSITLLGRKPIALHLEGHTTFNVDARPEDDG